MIKKVMFTYFIAGNGKDFAEISVERVEIYLNLKIDFRKSQKILRKLYIQKIASEMALV